MTVGALLHLGLPPQRLATQLATLNLPGYQIDAAPRLLHGIAAIKFDVRLDDSPDAPHRHDDHHHHDHHHDHDHDHDHHHDHAPAHLHRPYRDIRALIETSGLDLGVKDLALRIFAKLAVAEAEVHGVAIDDVTFHEVGAIDSIVDIVGAAIGFDWIGADRYFVSPLPLGSGLVRSQHGPIPVPGPATIALLRGFETRPGEGVGEMVTPTGAAIIAALAEAGAAPPFRVVNVGHGSGQRELADRPNLLRLVVGEVGIATDHDRIVVIETNIDDLNPEIYDYVAERLFAAGARDVFLTPVQMKKGRPGVVLTVLASPTDREALTGIVLRETSAIGVRYREVDRIVLPRRSETVETPYGAVRLKVATTDDGIENVAPEHDDCRRLAAECGVPLKDVYRAALAARGR